MSASAWHQFIFTGGLGIAVAGLTTYIITWMLVAVHLRDHHPGEHARLGGFLFAPHAFGWYLGAAWRRLHDRSLNALALLGSIGAWGIAIGTASAILVKCLASSGIGT